MECVNQHFVPQYYLKNFSNNGNVFVFDKERNDYLAKGNSLPINKIGFEKNIYDSKPELLQIFCNPNIETEKFLDKLIEKYNERILAPLIHSFVNLGEEVYKEKIELNVLTNLIHNLFVISAIDNTQV